MTQLEITYEAPCRIPERGQCRTLLEAMQRGERLTIWNAMTQYGVGALHQRVKDLREMNWPIKRAEVVRNVQGRDLAWHLSAVLEYSGEAVCVLVMKELGVKSAMDFVRRAA